MSPRTTGLLLIAALLLGAFVYVFEIREADLREGAVSVEDELFPGLTVADVEWIELTTTDDVLVRAERAAEGWRLVAPRLLAADTVALDGMASQLVGLDIEGRVTGDAPPEDFRLGKEAARVRFEAAGRTHTLRLGMRTPIGSNTYVRTGSSDEIAYVTTWRIRALRKSLTDLRDRRVLDFDHTAIDRIEVRWPDGGVSLERTGKDWDLLQPVRERADRATIETLLSDLAFLRADGFIDSPLSPEQSGLDRPVLTVRLAGGAEGERPFELELAFGALQGDQRIVRGADGALFLIDAERLDDFPRELLAYRFKALARFDVADARSLVLTLAAGKALAEADAEAAGEGPHRIESTLASGRWQTRPEGVSDERVRAMISTLSRLTGIAIVAEQLGPRELAALGLDPARMRVRVKGADGEELADVALGQSLPGRGIMAKRADSPIVYRVDETVAEYLPRDFGDFEARFARGDESLDDEVEPLLGNDENFDEIPVE